MNEQKNKKEYVDLSNVADEQKIKEEVEQFAMTHDDMRLPAEWLKYIPLSLGMLLQIQDERRNGNCKRISISQ